MAKSLLLDFEEEINYSIIGISSSYKDYRLMFFLNKIDEFEFKRAEPFTFSYNKTKFKYSLYTFIDDVNLRNFYLIANKSNAVKLVKKYQYFDYLLIMDGEIDTAFLKELSKKVKSVSGVVLTAILDDNEFNKIPNLRVEFDIHLDAVLS